MEWPGRCRLTVALLVLLALRNASAVAASDHDDDVRQSARCNTGEGFRGYEKKLKFAVPHKHGFQVFVNITHPNTEKQMVTGYSIDVFKTALEKLNNPLQYEFCAFDGTYDELVRNVSTRVYDAAVGDVTITAERVIEAEFTMPYIQSDFGLLVRPENDSKLVQWIFLEPLTKELWIAIVVGFFFTGFVVWMIEHPRNPEYQGSRLRQLSNASYFAFSTLTFSHEPIIRSPLSKIAIVVWCFAVLVLVQSYTANLSSILTTKQLRPLVTDLSQLLLNGDYIGHQEGAFIRTYLHNEGFPEKKLRAFRNQTEYAEALRKGSKNGGVSAIVDEILYLTYFLLDPHYEKEFAIVNHNYRTPGLGFVFPQGSPLVHNLSVAILELTQGNEVSEIERKWLGTAALTKGDDNHVADSAPLTLRSFSGLFVITGCVSTLMLLIRIAKLVYARCNRIQGSSLQNSSGEDGSANLGESNAMQDVMGYGSVSDQNHNEDRGDHSIQAPGSSMSVGNAELCQIHNGSVTKDSIQIEMNSIGHGVGLAL